MFRMIQSHEYFLMLSLVEGLQIIQVNGVHVLLGSSKNVFVGCNSYLLPSAVKFLSY